MSYFESLANHIILIMPRTPAVGVFVILFCFELSLLHQPFTLFWYWRLWAKLQGGQYFPVTSFWLPLLIWEKFGVVLRRKKLQKKKKVAILSPMHKGVGQFGCKCVGCQNQKMEGLVGPLYHLVILHFQVGGLLVWTVVACCSCWICWIFKYNKIIIIMD